MRPRILVWLATNVVFIACHPGVMSLMPAPARALAISAIMFVLPGAAWSWMFGSCSRAPGSRLARVIFISAAVLFAILGACRIAGVLPTQHIAWTAAWLITNAGFALGVRAGTAHSARRALVRREIVLGSALFVGSYSLYFYGATRVVPPMVDHALEVSGTAYGLITRFEPLLLTDRNTYYYFAHPPLLHVYAGGSFLYSGTLDSLKFYDDISRQALEGAHNADFESSLTAVYQRFEREGRQLELRAVNLFFSSATVALLGIWTGRISRRWWLGLLAAAAYAVSPEVFVRSSYGGYFAISGLATILMLFTTTWRYRRDWRMAVLPFLIGAWSALANHKLVLIPGAIAAVHFVASRRARALIPPVVAGFAAGTVAFWVFGLSIDAEEFVRDHLFTHGIDRFLNHDPFGYAGYPGRLGLWREFMSHTGYVLLPAALLAMAHDALASRRQSYSPSPALLLLWIIVTALVFTQVDWRQTKHLMPMLLGLHLAIVPARDAARWRVVLAALVLLITIAWSIPADISISRDFAAYEIRPGW